MNKDQKLLAEKYQQILLEAKFCGKCGAPLATPDSKFCGKCGAPVSGGQVNTTGQKVNQVMSNVRQAVNNIPQNKQPVQQATAATNQAQQQVNSLQQIKNQFDQLVKAQDQYLEKLKALDNSIKVKEDALMKQMSMNEITPQTAMAEFQKLQSEYKAQLAELEKTKPNTTPQSTK